MSRCSRVRIKVFRPNRSATVVAGLLLGIFFLLLGRPAHADTPITLVQSFAGRLNFAGTEATLRAAGNNTDACTVSNSAPATLSGIPTGATIKAAYLYWAGSSTPGYYWIIPAVPPDYTVTFENQSITAPANEQYLVQRTSAYGIGSNVFSGVADVTSIVQGRADPNGTYTLSDLTVDTNDYTHCAEQTVLAGWALLVIYSDPGEDFRVVNIYQGFQPFQGSEIVLVPSNFLVPSSPINGKFAHITWEGDRTNSAPANGFVEALEFDGSSLIDATNPAAEQFNSKSSAVNPDDQASWGVDFDVYDVTGYLSSGITSATSTYSSGGDLVLLSAEVLSITNTPVSDLAVTLAHTGTPAPPGPIQYVIDVQNEGPLEETGPVSITLTLPTGISYVSSSGTGWSCTGSGTTATCTTSGPVAVGGALPSLTINGNIAANTLSPVTATVTVSGVNFDNESNNDTATDTATWVNPTPPPPIGEPGSFNITEAGTDPHIGPIYTKIAGIGYTLNLWAFKNNGTQDNNPRNQGELYLLDATDNSGDEYGNDSGCRTTWTPIADLGPFDFTDNGSNNPLIVTLPQFPNALSSARILIVEDNGTLACSHDAFAIRPAYFAITASQDSPTTPGTTEILVAPVDASSTPYHRAGRPFTITLTPKNAAGATVTGYTTGAPAVAITGIVLPVGGTIGSYGDSGIWTFSGGTAYLETATYSEVGAFGAQATDAAFTVVDAGDGTSNCQRTIGLDCSQTTTPKYWSGPTTIGRFTPDHFDVDWNEPEFEPGCSAGFTYLQQTVGYAPAKAPELKVVAKSADGNPTVNYRSFKVAGDPFGRLTVAKIVNANSGWPDSGYSETDDSASPSDHPLDTNLVSALDNLTIQPDATDGSTGTIIFPPSTPTDNRLVIERLTAEPAAAGEPPFDATINLKLVVTDEDGVTAATNPATTTIPLGDVRYGRVLLRSAVGSELLDLPVEMIAQYYLDDDSGFVRNDEDVCSAVSGVSLANFQAYLGNTFANGNTAANFYQLNAPSRPGDLDTGNFGLSLSAPGSGHQGTVDISADVPMWLQYDWNGDGVYGDGTNADNPSSRAAFGIYKGNPHRVYQYEVIGAGS